MSKEGEPLRTLFLYACTNDGHATVILSKDAFDRLRKGNIIVSPDGQTIVSFSHDIEESSAQLDNMISCTGMVDKEVLGFIIREGARPPKKKRKKQDASNT